MTDCNRYEPSPILNEEPAVWITVIRDIQGWVGIPPSLISDMQSRDEFGRKKYGTPLQPHKGRDAIQDAYQEALDLCVYTKQAIMESPEDRRLIPIHEGAILSAAQLRFILDSREKSPTPEGS